MMKCAQCGAEMAAGKCKMCKGPMECNDSECSCKACNRMVKKEEMACDKCMEAAPQ